MPTKDHKSTTSIDLGVTYFSEKANLQVQNQIMRNNCILHTHKVYDTVYTQKIFFLFLVQLHNLRTANEIVLTEDNDPSIDINIEK